ncbi:MAG: hypothetical protein WAZ94_13385 [Phycisphaerales bacterium]
MGGTTFDSYLTTPILATPPGRRKWNKVRRAAQAAFAGAPWLGLGYGDSMLSLNGAGRFLVAALAGRAAATLGFGRTHLLPPGTYGGPNGAAFCGQTTQSGGMIGTAYTKSITSNSAASPTVVTCTGHGLVSGATVSISGQTGTVAINGTHVVTVVNGNTFTVPVDCTTGGGTGGTMAANIAGATDPHAYPFLWRNAPASPETSQAGLRLNSTTTGVCLLVRPDWPQANQFVLGGQGEAFERASTPIYFEIWCETLPASGGIAYRVAQTNGVSSQFFGSGTLPAADPSPVFVTGGTDPTIAGAAAALSVGAGQLKKFVVGPFTFGAKSGLAITVYGDSLTPFSLVALRATASPTGGGRGGSIITHGAGGMKWSDWLDYTDESTRFDRMEDDADGADFYFLGTNDCFNGVSAEDVRDTARQVIHARWERLGRKRPVFLFSQPVRLSATSAHVDEYDMLPGAYATLDAEDDYIFAVNTRLWMHRLGATPDSVTMTGRTDRGDWSGLSGTITAGDVVSNRNATWLCRVTHTKGAGNEPGLDSTGTSFDNWTPFCPWLYHPVSDPVHMSPPGAAVLGDFKLQCMLGMAGVGHARPVRAMV